VGLIFASAWHGSRSLDLGLTRLLNNMYTHFGFFIDDTLYDSRLWILYFTSYFEVNKKRMGLFLLFIIVCANKYLPCKTDNQTEYDDT
jgi:hypothetical protein